METIFANNTIEQGANPLGNGFSGLFSPRTETNSIMSQVAEGLENPEAVPGFTPTPATPSAEADVPGAPKSLAEAIEAAEKNGELEVDDPEGEKKGSGRTKTDKNLAISYIADRAKEGKLALFSDYSEDVPVEEYLSKLPQNRLYELFDKNLEDARTSAINEVEETAAQRFYESLSPEFRAMYEYQVNGGQDFSQFAQLIQGQNINAQLDPTNEEHQPIIARNYLEATGFGTAQMIQEQIQEWQNDGKLPGKVNQFKPMLDNMYQQEAQRMAYEQQQYAAQQEQAAREYITAVAETIKKGEIAGVKLSKQQQQELYRGLTVADKPSINGGMTNELEHLWEQVNYVQRDYERIAELQWYLKDREGFLNAIRQQGANGQASKDFTELKRLNVKGTGGSNTVEVPSTKENSKIRVMKPTFNSLWG